LSQADEQVNIITDIFDIIRKSLLGNLKDHFDLRYLEINQEGGKGPPYRDHQGSQAPESTQFAFHGYSAKYQA
jgi:hypothetical protein